MAWRIDTGNEIRVMGILGVILYYTNNVDREEYPDFENWKADMMKQGLLVRVEEA